MNAMRQMLKDIWEVVGFDFFDIPGNQLSSFEDRARFLIGEDRIETWGRNRAFTVSEFRALSPACQLTFAIEVVSP
jgi:hypothetical protein